MKKVTIQNYRKDKYYSKIVGAVESMLAEEKEVSPIDLYLKMGMIESKKIDLWKNGQIPYLEKVMQGSLSKLSRILKILRFHAHDLNLVPKITQYKRNKKVLRFSKSGDPKLEEAYSRHFVKAGKARSNKLVVEQSH